ncbi:MAG: hypothetical protein ACE5KU_05215 [Nitrososphaerales archaeon]
MSSSNIWVVGIVSGLILGLAISYLYFQPELSGAAERESTLRARIVDLEADAEDLNKALKKSEEDLSTAKAEAEDLRARLNDALHEKNQVENLLAITNSTLTETLRELDARKAELKEAREEIQSERDRYIRLSSQISMAERSLEQLESSKILLAELRKEMPITRNETKEYWENIRSLAAKIDPSLGGKIDKILFNLDIYFDWIESAPGFNSTLEDWAIWLLTPPQGAIDYGPSIDEFLNEVYLMIIRDIDAALEAAG